MRDSQRRRCEVLQELRGEAVTDGAGGTVHLKTGQRSHGATGSRADAVWRIIVMIGVALVLGVSGSAQIQMPDAREMSGIPRPVDDLSAGTVSVRLIRGDLSNNMTGHPVELRVGDGGQTANTDSSGRAEFRNLPPGARLKATAVVDDERLESQEFQMPAQGGIRLLLVATDKEKEKRAAEEAKAPAVDGQVVLGGESRIVVEPGDDRVAVYYLLDISNTARVPVNPTVPFEFDMPPGSTGATVLQGSSPLATVNGPRVRVSGPFPPGETLVRVACELPVSGGTMEIAAMFPAPVQQLVVFAKKVGNLRMSSPQFERQQEMPAGTDTLIVAAGGTIAAGQPILLTLSGLLHHSRLPRTVALILAGAVVFIGVWAAGRPADPASRSAERKRLVARREKLFQDLVRLEHDHRRGRLDEPRYSGRREQLVTALEQIYGALDEDTGPDPADRTGVAA